MITWLSSAISSAASYLSENWEPVVGYATLVVAIAGYFFTRRRELAWKRTEFLFAQSQYIDKDPNAVEALAILEGRHPDITLDALFGSNPAMDAKLRNMYLGRFDTLLSQFDLIAYSVLYAKTLSLKEAGSFGWYIQRIVRDAQLREYCDTSGYQDILELAKRLDILPEVQDDAHRDENESPAA